MFSFNSIARYLVKEGELTEAQRNLEYFKSFTLEMEKQIVDYISRANPKQRCNVILSFEAIQEAAKYTLMPQFFETRHGDSRSVMRTKAKISMNS